MNIDCLKLVYIMIILLIIFILCNIFIRKCSSNKYIEHFNVFSKKTEYVFICHSTRDNVFWEQIMTGVRAVASESKLWIGFFYAQGNPKNLAKAIHHAIRRKVKGIAIVLPYDDKDIENAMKKTTKHKIPVIVVNYGINKLYNNVSMRNIIGYVGQIETLGAKSIVQTLAANTHPPIYYTVFYDEPESGAIKTRFIELVKEAHRLNTITLVDKNSNAYTVNDNNINRITRDGMEKYGISFKNERDIDKYFTNESKKASGCYLHYTLI